MSRIAARVSSVRAAGATSTNRRPPASSVDTPSRVSNRYGVTSSPTGNRSWYANSAMGPPGVSARPARGPTRG